MMAACLKFSFSSVWIPAEENKLADTASRFQYSKLLQLAPHLPHKPSSQRSHLIGMKHMLTSHLKQPSTSGTDLRRVPARPIQQSAPFTSTKAYHPMHASPRQFDELFAGSSVIPGSVHATPNSPSHSKVLQKLAAAPRDLSIPFEASMYAAFKTAWAGFLHCGEFTLGQNKKLIPATNLTCGSVTFIPSFETLTHIRFDLPASETDPFQKGVSILIVRAPGGMSTWAVSALHHLFIIDRKPHDAPLFSNPDGSPLSRDAFVGTLEQSLTSCGFDPPKPTRAHPWALRPPPFGRLSGIQFHASGLSVRSSGGLSAISFPGSVQKSKGDQIHSICSH
ncbi:hypothetical protein C0989_002675 [Termitomyces sp. Mn162]|nr:hypothetical protein C0989_002675 [Termitomyces sp. Mn162]